MTNRERENKTLSFSKFHDRGAVEETFYPWTLTAERFTREGIPTEITNEITDITNDCKRVENELEKYLNVQWGESIFNYEKYLGFDPVRRVSFTLPFRRFEEIIIEDNAEYMIQQDIFGRYMKHFKNQERIVEYKHVVENEEDWKRLKERGDRELRKYYTDEKIEKAYGPLVEGHQRGDYSVRMNIEGFFWTPRGSWVLNHICMLFMTILKCCMT